MNPSGIIYDYHFDHPAASRHTLKPLGWSLITLSFAAIIFLFAPVGIVELRYSLQQLEHASQAQTSEPPVDESKIAVQQEAASYGVPSYFDIVIPKIDARAKVVPNVSTENPNDFDAALMEGVAHARGTFFPGQGRNIFLFAHSTDSPLNFARYNAVFYLLYKLEPKDQIILYFLDKKYVYTVLTKFTADPSDTSWLNKNFGTETLILQTCDPPGTTLRRLLIVATRQI